MEENERTNQMWQEMWKEFDELTGWRDIDFEANIIRRNQNDQRNDEQNQGKKTESSGTCSVCKS